MNDSNVIWQIQDVTAETLKQTTYDLGLFACGYEQRCIHIPSMLENSRVKEKIVIAFDGEPSPNTHHDCKRHYEQIWDSELLSADYHDDGPVYERLRRFQFPRERARILVDYSTMSRVWYNAVLNWLQHTPGLPPIEVDFVYSQGKYASAYQPLEVRDILALPGCEAEPKLTRRTFAIFGLGFDATVALAVLDRLEPDVVRAFYAAPGSSPEDATKAYLTNKSFIEMYSPLSLGLPISSVEASVRILEEMVAPELGRDNIVLVPLGPKPHVLAAMLLSRLHDRDIACVRVSGTRPPVDVLPTGDLVVTRVQWVPHSARQLHGYPFQG